MHTRECMVTYTHTCRHAAGSPVHTQMSWLFRKKEKSYFVAFADSMEMAIHSSIFAWKIPWTEEPGGLQSMGLQELDTT